MPSPLTTLLAKLASLTKHWFEGGEQLRDWWDEATSSPPGTSAGSDGAGYPLTLHQCFAWLLGRVQRGTDCSHILHITKENQNPTKTKVEGNKCYSKWGFLEAFSSFSGKAASLPSVAAATSKACIILWNGVSWLWAVTGWFSACKVTLWLFSPLSLSLSVWLSRCLLYPQEISSSSTALLHPLYQIFSRGKFDIFH